MFIECPSGLSGEIRRFKVRDYDLFGDKSLARKKGPMVSASICKRLWESTTNPGPYQMGEDGNPQWTKDVMEHDRFYILIQARIEARGEMYDHDFQCENDACSSRIRWTLNLNDLEVVKAPEDVLNTFMAGNQFEVVLPHCQRTVHFQLPTFDVQRRIDVEVQKHGQKLSSVYAGRIEAVEDIQVRSQIYDFVADMDAKDFDALDRAIQATDFGVRTNIEVECDRCDWVQEHELTMGRNFFIGGR